jgi:hypothetical protein
MRQPWAYLITQGPKNTENRGWSTKYLGPFLFHASLTIDKKGCLEHGLDPSKLQTNDRRLLIASKGIEADGLSDLTGSS